MRHCEYCNCDRGKQQPQQESLWVDSSAGRPYPPLQRDTAVDVAIVGGGITGITAAYLLKKAGKKVAVLEAAQLGSGVTGYTTAHITEVLDVRFKDIVRRFGEKKGKVIAASQRAAIEQIAHIVAQEHIDCDFTRVPGYLFAEKEEHMAQIRDEKVATEKLEIPATVTTEIPLPFPTAGALRLDNQAQFHPLQYVQALAKLVHGGGSFVHQQTRVQEISKKPPHHVTTDHGTITAQAVILATHTPILKILSLQAKIAAYRSYVVGVKLAHGSVPSGLFWDTEHPYHYIRSYHDTVIVGGEDHRQGEKTDTLAAYEALQEYACHHFPINEIAYQWSAQVFNPYDGLPLIGKTPGYDAVYLATGYAGNGMTGGTLSAMIVSDLVLGKENAWASLYKTNRLTFRGVIKKFIAQQWFVGQRVVRSKLSSKPTAVAEGLSSGQGGLIRLNGKTVAAYRNEHGELTTLSPLCPHAGCIVQWNKAEKTWDCPCHGSRFTATGKVKVGPAVKDLSPSKP